MSTNFITNKYPYINQDLNTIFANLTTEKTPVYSDLGKLVFGGPGPFGPKSSSSSYYKFSNYTNVYTDGTNNSFFKITNNGIVDVGFTTNGASYFKFNSKGLYTLTMSYTLTLGANSDESYDIVFYMRLTDNSSLSQTTMPLILSFDNIYNVASHGNNSYNNGVTGQTAYNIEYIYNNNNTGIGYYVFINNFKVNSSTIPWGNNFNVSMTVYIPDICNIYPQFMLDTGTSDSRYPWTWEGNWMVTKLSDINIGSLLGNGFSYAEGLASENLAATVGQPFTIELFFFTNSLTSSNNQILFSLGGSTYSPLIQIGGTNSTLPGKIGLVGYNGGGSIYTSTTVSINTWYHIAFTRDESNNYIVYLNGEKDYDTVTIGDTIDPYDSVVTVGSFYRQPFNGLNGNISNLRLTQKVVYTDNFTVPSVPLQTTQNASVNINAINGGECVYLLQCYETYPFKNTVTDVNLINNGLTFSISSPT